MSVLEMTASKKLFDSTSIIKMNNQTIRELRAIAKERGLRGYYKLRKDELVNEWGATYFDEVMSYAAWKGRVEIVKLYKEWGATDFNWAMSYAAKGGHVEIVKLCKEWGATDFDEAMSYAAWKGHVEIVKLCKEWGATDFDWAMCCLLYTSPSPRDATLSRMPSSA